MAANIGVFVDPACPWAWITSRWITEVAPKRALTIRWRSFSPDVRDGGVRLAPAIPKHLRHVALERRRIGAVALQVFEWLRNEVGEQAVERFYTQLGYRLNDPDRPGRSPMRSGCGTRLPPSSRALHSSRRAAHDRCHSSHGQWSHSHETGGSIDGRGT